MTSGMIFDLRRFSIHDGPGIRTSVFFKGCPLACAWCHNPESQSAQRERIYRQARCILCGACVESCPEHALQQVDGRIRIEPADCDLCGACAEACLAQATELSGRKVGVDEVLAEVLRDVPFYDESGGGVTLSGGEPLLQADFAAALLKACKAAEIHTALDTCGYARWETLERVLPWVDLFLYDLKLIDDERHRARTGVSNRVILENLQRLVASGKAVIARIPLIPGVNDDDGNLQASAQWLAQLGGIRRVDLLPYHPGAEAKYARLGRAYELAGAQSQSSEQLEDCAAHFRALGLDVRLGG